MRQFPREIEADLLSKGIDIFDWHQGRMSSRRLLVLIDALKDDSAYWRERRDGDWSDKEYIWAALVNELRLMRADQAAMHADHKMEINMVKSPAQHRESDEEIKRHAEVREHLLAQLHKTE